MALSKVINENMENAKEEILKKTLKEANKMFEKIKKSNENSMLISSNIIHSHVTCDGCGAHPIIGNRYKCTVCEDFDYCDQCEELNSETHKHPFLKIRKPEVAPVKILCAIREDMQEYHNSDVVKLQAEPNQTEGLFNKVKNTITDGIKTIPTKISEMEGIILDKVNNLIDPQSEIRKKYQNVIPVVRQNYLLENVTDEQLLDALARSNGNVDDAVCFLFSDN
jgi:uncharacterized CHY-type Zn-finger protein